MQAIEFNAIAKQHILHIPDNIPDGTHLRVLILLDDTNQLKKHNTQRKPSKKLLGSIIMMDDLIVPAIADNEWNLLS